MGAMRSKFVRSSSSGCHFRDRRAWPIAAVVACLVPALIGAGPPGIDLADKGGCPCLTDVTGEGYCDPPNEWTDFIDISYLLDCVLAQADPCGGSLSICDVNCDDLVDMCDVGAAVEAFLNMPDPCDIPCGACCSDNPPVELPPCVVTTERGCAYFYSDGVYQGDGVPCDPDPCLPPQACCVSDQCVLTSVRDCLVELEGVPVGLASCDPNPCEYGACCTGGGSCVDEDPGGLPVDKPLCDALGGDFKGGTVCADSPCPEPQACCEAPGICIDWQLPSDCRAADGAPLGPGSECFMPEGVCEMDEPCVPPGTHWVDYDPPGVDTMPSAAVVGIDTDLDCVADTSLVMGGPVTVLRYGAVDASIYYPLLKTIDGHLDIIDTEIIAMTLTAGGMELRAGGGGGAGGVLKRSLGAIAEQVADPAVGDSFFDVYFEFDLGGGSLVYNHAPLRIQTVIDCVPPQRTYIHPTGCTWLYDRPPGDPAAVHIANLVSARHSTFPPPEACCLPDGSCVDMEPEACRIVDGASMGPGTDCSDPDICNMDEPCEPTGPHWIDTSNAGYDRMASALLAGVDTTLDCTPETSLIMSGPVTIKRTGALDISAQFPGQIPDGHLDVIDTEMVQMYLTGGGMILRAGGGGGGGGVLQASLGAIVERVTDPVIGESFFDVYFEFDIGGGTLVYNHAPFRVRTIIDCVPPRTAYIHPVGCTWLYDRPPGVPGAIHVANLVSADHGTFPTPTEACCMPDRTCVDMDPQECRQDDGAAMGAGTDCSDPTICEEDEPCVPTEDHWIDTSPPGPDHMPSSALIGIDLDLDIGCTSDWDAIMSGPVTIMRRGSSDDSARYPGLRPVDGHVDVIDTEITGMLLTSGGKTLRAGGGGGAGGILLPSFGAIAEQLADPSAGDSFFNVYFEFDLGGGNLVYNHTPLVVQTKIDCVPPRATYIHPTGCILLFNGPPGDPTATVIARLTSANHKTFPPPPEQACCLPDGTCEELEPEACRAQDGAPMGVGTDCSDPAICDMDEECQDCGPGNHWVDTCFEGYDRIPTAALAGIDTTGNCVANTNLILNGPASIHRTDPMDDSAQYPGLRPIDGHLEVMDTEIVQMFLTGGGVTLRAGAGGGGGGAGVLQPTYGAIAEEFPQPPGDNRFAESFFDVMFEVDLGGGQLAYNHTPLRVEQTIDCVPPRGRYFHVNTCVPLFDAPSPPANWVANLVRPDHMTFVDPVDDEVDFFPKTKAKIHLTSTIGSETVALSGPSTVVVDLAALGDNDADGREEVPTEIVNLDLTGNSLLFGPVHVTVRSHTKPPYQRSTGEIEETSNDTPGTLDIPPFEPIGTGDSFFDVYFEIDVGGDIYHNNVPKHMETVITYKPPAQGDTYEDPQIIYLFDESDNPAPFNLRLEQVSHTPDPPPRDPDPHMSVPGLGHTSTYFGNPVIPPIPADFFGPGSDPFEGQIAFENVPIDPELWGDASTLVVRNEDPVFPEDPVGTIGTVEIEITELSLRSIEPITVTYFGGMDPEVWDVFVSLSGQYAGVGELTATKTHENGGTYDMTLPVNPLLIFRRVSDGQEVVLDAPEYLEGPLYLAAMAPSSWVHNVDPDLGVMAPYDGIFVPGVEEMPAPGIVQAARIPSASLRTSKGLIAVDNLPPFGLRATGMAPERNDTLQGTECPPDSLYAQPVQTSGWSAGVSDEALGWQRYESFSGVTEPICDVHWWGIDLAWDGGWVECTENPMPFNIIFYEDNGGLPGAEVCSYTIGAVPGVWVMETSGYDLWEYEVVLDSCCYLTDGWVTIQGGATGDPTCYFLWMSSEVGDSSNCFFDGELLDCGDPDHAYDLSVCLTPGTYQQVIVPLVLADPIAETWHTVIPPPRDLCVVANPAVQDPSPAPGDIGFGRKNRYLSFSGGDLGRLQAVQVTFTNLPGYPYANGRTAWVQEPYLVTEASGSPGPVPPPTMWAAVLGCTPFYTDWSTYGTVDVFDDGIVWDGTYDIRLLDSTCNMANPADYSAPLTVLHSKSGDIVGDCGVTPCSAPQGVVDFVDISACVEKFKNDPGAPRKARADIVNSTITMPKPDQIIDFVDISCIVEAFRGTPCPLPGPPPVDPCPGP